MRSYVPRYFSLFFFAYACCSNPSGHNALSETQFSAGLHFSTIFDTGKPPDEQKCTILSICNAKKISHATRIFPSQEPNPVRVGRTAGGRGRRGRSTPGVTSGAPHAGSPRPCGLGTTLRPWRGWGSWGGVPPRSISMTPASPPAAPFARRQQSGPGRRSRAGARAG